MTPKTPRPAADQAARGAGISDQLGSRSNPRSTATAEANQDTPSPALWSEALCAAGKCVAAVRAGFVPTRIELHVGRIGWWVHRIDGFDASLGSTIGREIVLAGTTARHLSDFNEPDLAALVENTALMAALKVKTETDFRWFMQLTVAAGKLVLRHETIIRVIAGRLVIAKTMSSEELAAHLAPVFRRKTA
jgi:hypothetical protein